jgi:hypothetical protein
MTSIQGGKVTYGRTVKTGDYENKRADVEIMFNVEEGQDADTALDIAATMAKDKIHQMLGIIVKSAPVVTNTPRAGETAEQTAVRSAPRGDKEAAAAAAMNGADAKPTPKVPKAPKAAAPKAEPTPEPAPEPKAADPVDDFDSAEEPEITDTQLTAEASRKNKELQETHQGAAPAMIRKLIGEFVGAGKQMKDIEQAKRAEFLRRLKEMK